MKIIVFTQIPKLRAINHRTDEITNYFNNNHFNVNYPKLEIIVDDDNFLILVFDNLDITNNTRLIASIKESTNIVIKHSNMDNSIIENTNNIGIFSMHDEYDERNKPYKLVIDFLLSQRDTTAFATLKNALESEYIQSDLKKKLQLLHNIYEGGPQVKADDSIKEKVGDALGIFNNSIKISYDNKEKLHREALIVLRDALLADV